MNDEQIIIETKLWIKEVVIGLNFCPFAKKVYDTNTIRYVVVPAGTEANCLATVIFECGVLDDHTAIATTLLIFPDNYNAFLPFLNLLQLSETELSNNDYDGIYQLASFHPDYMFAGSHTNDPANYTNRSIYPMLHLLRESAIDQAVSEQADANRIPDRNIEVANQKGLLFMQQLRSSCMIHH